MTEARKRILFAEDDPSIQKVTRYRLEHEGYDVIAVSDGAQALEQVRASLPIHLILLDVKMPKLNGYEVCRALKQQADTADIPVIVFTGSETQFRSLVDRCIEVGAWGWMTKPFRTRELLEKIRQALGEGEVSDE